MQKIAVIVAGGTGQRMGASVPKQFLLLNGQPILWHTLNRFLSTWHDLRIILVLPAEHKDQGQAIIQSLHATDRIKITEGGDTRFQSVKNGLSLIHEPSVVFVHDGVRCLLSSELIKRCYEQTLEKGSAIPAVAATDSIRIVEGEGHYVADRNLVRIIQTPQTFLSDLLLPAFQQSYQASFTDEATVVEAADKKVFLIEGEYTNIKITRPEDLQLAEQILQRS
ncbi:MAG: 2-C-methyl-D-erythritol 4-phosphate cytidylyltransferase [Sediminibacterium sp.]|jgi:2-C-methyl-D-erythritol 4-phosphate cytidylyltransferase|uniref:2-C-methyl-D-erythritol 4-phosphate cytidylyltransferase n=1 Tax=Sediminibacterium sp. TaxID=1917865 RepID=UPI002AB9A64C|nr:2-C-methyl-D-erythritol 4-phosphate cytidylyltransferase [Sediminibacterium sp.]MDZ4072440.1 2-C-methyl-D-erythritol 4-phosphate cytidylyltransferase [Sediminibacterium sp.]